MLFFKGRLMSYQCFTLFSLTLMLLVGCGEDTASKRNFKNREPIIKESYAVYSGIHRERGSALVFYKDEISGNALSAVRSVPDIRFDDDGSDGKNVTFRTALTRPAFPCGLVLTATLAEKIADCALKEKNGPLASWSGMTHANSAEANWSLVVLSEDTKGTYEVWVDKKTGMVWSDTITNEANWCEASGALQGESDNVGVNCPTLGKGQSLCTNLSVAELTKVQWRLPTRNDYLQADIDGLRFVVSNKGINSYWTATASSDTVKRDKAWTYIMPQGGLLPEPMNIKKRVRCIGAPNF